MSRQPDWARWPGADEANWTLGVEEEVMLLHPEDWSLAQKIDDVLAELDEDRAPPHELGDPLRGDRAADRDPRSVQTAVAEVRHLRRRLTEKLDGLGLRAGCSGTHPFANWHDMRSPAPTATRPSTARCARSRGASRRSRCTSTSACPRRPARWRRSTRCARTCRSCSR
jgi:hypothetical protein